MAATDAQRIVLALSTWIDDEQPGLGPRAEALSAELLLHRRIVKLLEENGEVAEALIGVTGANPRKGVTHTWAQLQAELLDVAVTALAAWEHTNGNEGGSLEALEQHLAGLAERIPPQHLLIATLRTAVRLDPS